MRKFLFVFFACLITVNVHAGFLTPYFKTRWILKLHCTFVGNATLSNYKDVKVLSEDDVIIMEISRAQVIISSEKLNKELGVFNLVRIGGDCDGADYYCVEKPELSAEVYQSCSLDVRNGPKRGKQKFTYTISKNYFRDVTIAYIAPYQSMAYTFNVDHGELYNFKTSKWHYIPTSKWYDDNSDDTVDLHLIFRSLITLPILKYKGQDTLTEQSVYSELEEKGFYDN